MMCTQKTRPGEQFVRKFGVKMSDNEFKYLKDMRGKRKMECNHGVDPVWFTAVMRRQRKLGVGGSTET